MNQMHYHNQHQLAVFTDKYYFWPF